MNGLRCPRQDAGRRHRAPPSWCGIAEVWISFSRIDSPVRFAEPRPGGVVTGPGASPPSDRCSTSCFGCGVSRRAWGDAAQKERLRPRRERSLGVRRRLLSAARARGRARRGADRVAARHRPRPRRGPRETREARCSRRRPPERAVSRIRRPRATPAPAPLRSAPRVPRHRDQAPRLRIPVGARELQAQISAIASAPVSTSGGRRRGLEDEPVGELLVGDRSAMAIGRGDHVCGPQT